MWKIVLDDIECLKEVIRIGAAYALIDTSEGIRIESLKVFPEVHYRKPKDPGEVKAYLTFDEECNFIKLGRLQLNNVAFLTIHDAIEGQQKWQKLKSSDLIKFREVWHERGWTWGFQ